MKLIPLNAPKGPGSRCFTSVQAAVSEIRLLEKMQRVPGFVEFRGACVLKGSMPRELAGEWERYKAAGRTVGSRDPRRRGAYTGEQLWLLVEMSDAGANLEPGCYVPPSLEAGRECVKGQRYLSVKRTWDIYWQVVRALAKAEVYAGFEHRDLHLGNICARDTRVVDEAEDLKLVGREEMTPFSLDQTGVEVTIIDYSLSRAEAEGDEVLFYDIKKNDAILKGEGDLQYDVYRYMAEIVGEESCRAFVPKTNVLWLAFLIRKLLEVTLELSEEAMVEEGACVTAARKMRGILEEVRDGMRLEDRDKWELVSAGDLLDLGAMLSWFRPEEIVNG